MKCPAACCHAMRKSFSALHVKREVAQLSSPEGRIPCRCAEKARKGYLLSGFLTVFSRRQAECMSVELRFR